jgi:hypothetical protein
MNTLHTLYPDVARFEIDRRLRDAVADRRRREVRNLTGWPRRRANGRSHEDLRLVIHPKAR